jgi:hypothetical protein
MKKECAYTLGMLPRYLKGHIFLPQQKRVESHLASCPVCRSRHDALRQTDETREILRYFDPNEGFAGRVKAGFAGITRLFFRPFWLAMIIAAALAVQHFVIRPLLHDPDLEKLDAGAPPQAAVKLETPPVSVATPTPAASEQKKQEHAPVAAASKAEPFVATITVEKETEKASIARINEAMKEHALLTSLRFSDKVREVTGSLTRDELYTFFDRIRAAGKITYKRSRLASAASGEPLPFVLKLQSAAAPPRPPVERPASRPADKTVAGPADRPAEKADESTAAVPVTGPEDKPAQTSTQAPQ